MWADLESTLLVILDRLGSLTAARSDDPESLARIVQGLMTGIGLLGGGAIVEQGTDGQREEEAWQDGEEEES